MYATDFEYDGQTLSDFGFIVCEFDSSNGVSVGQSTGITFNKVSRNAGRQCGLVNTSYNECLTATFDICKNPCKFDGEDMYITDYEYRDLLRWLCRREFLKLRIITDDKDDCYYNASFNAASIKVADRLCGVRLTMETDKPFGYGARQEHHLDFTENTVALIRDTSDEIGCLCPDIIITCKEDGDLTITNSRTQRPMVIKNCKNGEIITIKGSEQIIQSNLASHNICNDFNFEFLQLANSYADRENQIAVSGKCTIDISYFPVLKTAF